jgi:hypothetical protein
MSKFVHIDRSILSLLFTNFNRLKRLTHGVQPVLIDWKYLCKALGDAMCYARIDKDPLYTPTTRDCQCYDNQNRYRINRKDVNGDPYTGPCKHIIRQMLLDPQLDVDQVMFTLMGVPSPSHIMLDKEIEL